MENLVDIKDFEFDFNQTTEERMNQFISFVKDPYNFMCKGHTVHIEFAGNADFETCLAHGLENSK